MWATALISRLCGTHTAAKSLFFCTAQEKMVSCAIAQRNHFQSNQQPPKPACLGLENECRESLHPPQMTTPQITYLPCWNPERENRVRQECSISFSISVQKQRILANGTKTFWQREPKAKYQKCAKGRNYVKMCLLGGSF